jgi:hypothetical protein
LRPFKDIFREVEAFDYKCEAFIRITRLIEDIFREMEGLIRGFFKDYEASFNGIEAFQSDVRLF